MGPEAIDAYCTIIAGVTVAVGADGGLRGVGVTGVEHAIVVVVAVVAVADTISIQVSGGVVTKAQVREVADPVGVRVEAIVRGVVVGERAEAVGAHSAVVAGVIVAVGADIGVERRAIGRIEDTIIVLVEVAQVAEPVGVGVEAVSSGNVIRERAEAVGAHGAVVAGVTVAVGADGGLRGVGVAGVEHAIVVVVAVVAVAEAISVQVSSGVVTKAQIRKVADAIAVSVGAVITRVWGPVGYAAVVAAIRIEILAERGVRDVNVTQVSHRVVVGICLQRIVDQPAVVACVPKGVAVRVLLPEIRDEDAVVHGVDDGVAVVVVGDHWIGLDVGQHGRAQAIIPTGAVVVESLV